MMHKCQAVFVPVVDAQIITVANRFLLGSALLNDTALLPSPFVVIALLKLMKCVMIFETIL
jgi:hypothetical protein